MARSAEPVARSTALRLVAGKGGVGRTTIAVALAASAAASGRRVLAVDAVGTGDLDRLVDTLPGLPRFETLRLTTGEALDQYLKIYLRLPVGPRRLGPLSRIFDYVSAAAPGVREILVIGKIGWEVREGQWDEVVVDGPATGHVVELLDAPRTMAELVATGPLAEQTGWLREILASPSTGVVVVSSPDELSVSETGELIERIRTETETTLAMVVANRLPPTLDEPGRAEAGILTEGGDLLGRLVELAVAGDATTTAALQRLSRLASVGNRTIPVVAVPDDSGDPVGRVIEAIGTTPGVGPDPLASGPS